MSFKSCGLNFSNQYKFEEIVDHENRKFSLTISEHENFIPDFFPDNIVNLTAIVGANGAGKSNLLEFLVRLLTNRLYLGERFLCAVRDSKGEVRVFHTLFDIINNKKSNSWNVDIKAEITVISNPEEVYVPYEEIMLDIDFEGIPELYTGIVFYNPALDLKNYPGLPEIETKYADVSTNHLLFKDSENDYEKAFDQVTLHRFKNVYRQFALVQSELAKKHLAQISHINIPDRIEIRFNKNSRVEVRDLGTYTRSLYEWLRKFASKSFGRPKSLIDEAKKSGDWNKKQKAKLEKVKVWFVVNLIDNFFYNLALIKDLDDEVFYVKQEDIESDDFLSTVFALFQEQSFINNKEFSINDFINRIFEIIDTKAILDQEIADNEAFFIVPVDVALEIHKLHYQYRSQFENQYSLGFLDFDWRDLSTGEKAFLDLYSRIFYGHDELTKDTTEFPTIIYIIIDEGELGFHPQWQKQYIHNLLLFLSKLTDIRIQVILTSHSPFVLSDLPNANIILLKKENNKTNVVDLEKSHQNFAANIHELFTDSFFIQGGMMGEFAKKKIENIIKNLNRTEISISANRESMKKQITMVGEPIIKERLWDLYFEKFGDLERIANLRREADELENKLRKNSNDSD